MPAGGLKPVMAKVVLSSGSAGQSFTGGQTEFEVEATNFRRLVLDYENKEARHHEDLRHSAEEEQQHKAAELIGKHMSEEGWRNLIHGARTAAEQGLKEYQLLRFPSQLCSDGGRAVNAPDPDWPTTLRARRRKFFNGGATI